jgi:hypothetical protein
MQHYTNNRMQTMNRPYPQYSNQLISQQAPPYQPHQYPAAPYRSYSQYNEQQPYTNTNSNTYQSGNRNYVQFAGGTGGRMGHGNGDMNGRRHKERIHPTLFKVVLQLRAYNMEIIFPQQVHDKVILS